MRIESVINFYKEKTKLPIIGVIYKNSELNFESRHLGLIPAKEKNLKLQN